MKACKLQVEALQSDWTAIPTGGQRGQDLRSWDGGGRKRCTLSLEESSCILPY